MHFYKSENKHVIGISGGKFGEFNEEACAIILDEKPIPTRKWESPFMKYQTHNEILEAQCFFREFSSGDKRVYVFEIEEYRLEPGYIRSKMEFFVDKEYLDMKVDQLRQINQLAVFDWDIANTTWVEIERNFEYEDMEDQLIFNTMQPLH
ncbi:hypothetical protein [Metabacillus bambusae]|uniref:Uncharacterized protein n=1 Tax=Metabacillus bambusae TaxID=2795218 RepID=A0ABS3N9V0_9BACI|nr:hypothetical protein [Metabacillus bambusae]MBO1515069.1 hypothetical protein [Metabacillus bambusae]